MARARTIKQSLALAFGRYRYRLAQRPHGDLPPEIAEAHARWQALPPGQTLCAACGAAIPLDADPCPACGQDPLPF